MVIGWSRSYGSPFRVMCMVPLGADLLNPDSDSHNPQWSVPRKGMQVKCK